MSLLRPLLIDTVPTIQQTAALALGRLANHSDELAAAVVTDDILPQLVYSLADQNRSRLTQTLHCMLLCLHKHLIVLFFCPDF